MSQKETYKWSFYDDKTKDYICDLHLSVPLPQFGDIINLGNDQYKVLLLENGHLPGSTRCTVEKVK